MKSILIITAALSLGVLSPVPASSGNADSLYVIRSSTLRIVKWNPFPMLGQIPCAQFSYEYPFGLNRTLQHEVGFISNTISPVSMFSRQEITGIKLRTEIRYYTGQGKGRGMGDFYVAPEISYTYYNEKLAANFSKDDGSTELIDFVGKRSFIGTNIKFGKLYHFGGSPVALDFFLGFGLKYRYITSELPDNLVLRSSSYKLQEYMEAGGSLRFNVNLGLRLGYVFPSRDAK